MKTSMLLPVILAALLCGESRGRAAVSLTVTPAVVSNTYPGFITLNLTGLTNGEQVKVQTYLDLNGNGVVDAGEPLIDAFNLTDGQANVIGGVTNISVPFDRNAAIGAITATLSFAPTLENIVGQKIYRVVSNPSGAFTPVTATFAVTNALTGQSVSGLVYGNGSAPLPHAIVVALTVTNQSYAGAAIADSSGHYFLTLPPGSYFLLPALPGYFADQNLAPMVTLTNGAAATNDLVATNGAVTISGQIFDAVSSNALGGVFAQFNSGSLLAVAFTDTNGDYTAGVTADNWKIQISPERLARRGYVTPEGSALKVNATLGSVTNAGLALYKGNALFYGQLTLSNTPVPNIPVEANDGDEMLHGKSYTDASGNYAVIALVDTNVLGTNDPGWFCSVNNGDQLATVLANDIINQTGEIPLTNGEAFLQNFGALPVTATISGQLVNNSGQPLSSISIDASATINGNQYGTANVDTDANGNYSLGVVSGQWFVSVNNSGGGGNNLNDAGYYDPVNLHGVTIPPNHAILNITVYPLGTPFLDQAEKISPTQFGFNLTGSAGFNYTVQASTNLASTNWSTVLTLTNFSGSQQFIQDNQATSRQKFYRVLTGP